MKKRHIFGTWLFLAPLALAGCGEAPPSEEIGEASLAQTVCAAGATVEGIDVSVWQGSVAWQSVANAGIDFGIARVSYGTSVDSWFDKNWTGMKSAGLLRGGYQFFLPNQDAIAQADVMINAMGPLGPGDLPAVMDLEDTGGQSASTIIAKLKQWLAHVEAGTGKKPIIYTGKYFWQDNVASHDFGDYPLWIPNYSYNCPNLPDNYWSDWRFFQYTDTGNVPGVSGNVDRNKWNGSLADLQAFADNTPDYAAKFVSQSFPYASDGAVQIEAGAALEVTLELKNVGKKAWDSNTFLGTTEPRDRASVFAGPEWPGPNRYTRVLGTVLPGETYQFTFTLHAPAKTGVYDEHFNLLEEGVTWFSDPGQGGPPDAQLEGLFEVIASTSAGAGGGGQGGQGGEGVGVGGVGGSTGSSGEVPGSGSDPNAEASCAMSSGRTNGGGFAFGALLLLASLKLRRRRTAIV